MEFKSILFFTVFSIFFFVACGEDDDQSSYWQEGQPCGGLNRIIIDGSCRCPENDHFSLARLSAIDHNTEGGCHPKNKRTWFLETDCPCENYQFAESHQMAVSIRQDSNQAYWTLLHYISTDFQFSNTTYIPIENGGDYLRFEIELNSHMECRNMCDGYCRGVVEGYFSEDDKIGDFTLNWYNYHDDGSKVESSCKWRMYRDW